MTCFGLSCGRDRHIPYLYPIAAQKLLNHQLDQHLALQALPSPAARPWHCSGTGPLQTPQAKQLQPHSRPCMGFGLDQLHACSKLSGTRPDKEDRSGASSRSPSDEGQAEDAPACTSCTAAG